MQHVGGTGNRGLPCFHLRPCLGSVIKKYRLFLRGGGGVAWCTHPGGARRSEAVLISWRGMPLSCLWWDSQQFPAFYISLLYTARKISCMWLIILLKDGSSCHGGPRNNIPPDVVCNFNKIYLKLLWGPSSFPLSPCTVYSMPSVLCNSTSSAVILMVTVNCLGSWSYKTCRSFWQQNQYTHTYGGGGPADRHPNQIHPDF